MNYKDIENARFNAQKQIELADIAARDAAKICAGRLQIANVAPFILTALKKELKNFNMHTYSWAQPKEKS